MNQRETIDGKIEKVRQEIMRFRELLTLMQKKVNAGERAYKGLFAGCTPEEIETVKEKDLQLKVARQIAGDLKPLTIAVLQLRFDAREMEKALEELYNIIITPDDE